MIPPLSLGQFIKQTRESLSLKQSDLAEMLGLSQQTVSLWEAERPVPPRHGPALAAVLKLDGEKLRLFQFLLGAQAWGPLAQQAA